MVLIRVQNNTPKAEIAAFRVLNLKGCFLVLFICFALFPKSAECAIHEISEVFIEATGNNKYEAKIKAHERGMMRAFFLVADKMGIKHSDIQEAPYVRLKEVFKPVMLFDELSTLEKYNATVTYQYDKAKLYQLLLDYGNSVVQDMFYEALVLPVFKQRNVFNIWDKEKKWNDIWYESKSILNNHKILYPTKSFLADKKINAANIFNLKYNDFLETFPNSLFKNVIIITTEFFTNRRTGESLMKVDTYILKPDEINNTKLEEEYELASLDDINHNVNSVIDKVINLYGALRTNTESESIDQKINDDEEKEQKPIIMNFDVFSPEEMDLVVGKLEKVVQIDKFSIEHDYDTKYKILIYTNASEFDLAEGLYLNGLSYKIHGSLYNLIDVKKGS
jgi:hypothetical protein